MIYYSNSNYVLSSGNRSKKGYAIAYDVGSILSYLGIRYSTYNSNEDFDSNCIYNITDAKSASNGDLTFCSSDDVEKAVIAISKCKAKVILCH